MGTALTTGDISVAVAVPKENRAPIALLPPSPDGDDTTLLTSLVGLLASVVFCLSVCVCQYRSALKEATSATSSSFADAGFTPSAIGLRTIGKGSANGYVEDKLDGFDLDGS